MKQFKILAKDKPLVIVEADDVADNYHSMSELYRHRYALFCALVKVYDNYITPIGHKVNCWKSKQHSDGTMFDDSFIVGMSVFQFEGPPAQITYHLPIEWWFRFKVREYPKAPPYDGHSSEDVIERLLKL